jgi:Putative Ig domain
MRRGKLLCAFALLTCISAGAQILGEGLAITTDSSPNAALHQNYFHELRARGGTVPLHWQITRGALPPGLALDAATGRIAGAATSPGDYAFAVKVTDAAQPAQVATREFVLKVLAPLTMEWKLYPHAEGDRAIRGAVAITNGTGDAFDMTFIAVAVNEIGKAFALGYQHFTLAPASTSPRIEFGSTLPAGQYVVHVDAVAEVPASGVIYRARKQTTEALVLTGLP